MMDYGVYLKQTVGNLNRSSKSYSRQSAFHGSRRQVRGRVLRLLGERPYGASELVSALDDSRAAAVMADLLAEGLIRQSLDGYRLG
jgi:A/G-specific adenine glycosylase